MRKFIPYYKQVNYQGRVWTIVNGGQKEKPGKVRIYPGVISQEDYEKLIPKTPLMGVICGPGHTAYLKDLI